MIDKHSAWSFFFFFFFFLGGGGWEGVSEWEGGVMGEKSERNT